MLNAIARRTSSILIQHERVGVAAWTQKTAKTMPLIIRLYSHRLFTDRNSHLYFQDALYHVTKPGIRVLGIVEGRKVTMVVTSRRLQSFVSFDTDVEYTT